MNTISPLVFLVFALIIFIWINKKTSEIIFGIKSKKQRQINIYDLLKASIIGTIISVIVIDTFDVIFRIVWGIIANFGNIPVDRIKVVLAMKYIPEFWFDDLFIKLVIFAPLSVALSLIFLKIHKNKKF